MIRSRLRHKHKHEAELDITSFMNLMIILVPVLLMSMVFARITVLDLTLPKAADSQTQTESEDQPKQLEVVIRDNQLIVNYPAAFPVPGSPIEAKESGEHDYERLSELLQDVKITLSNQGIDKEDIVILSEPDTDYQTLVRVMDTVRSFKAVVAASVVDAELFPAIALGDAPVAEAQ